jgi:hypothetical protein
MSEGISGWRKELEKFSGALGHRGKSNFRSLNIFEREETIGVNLIRRLLDFLPEY